MMQDTYDPLRVPHDGYADIGDCATRLILGQVSPVAPRVSILIPTYRRPELLREALASALGQGDVADYEVIVLDNDPTPDTPTEAVVRQYMCPRLTYYRNERNVGMTGNWNRCIQLARGDWISLLHDDDYLSPAWLRKMLEHLPADADMLASYAKAGSEPLGPGSFESRSTALADVSRVTGERMILGNVSPAPGLLIRKRALLECGGFDDSYYPCADYDVYIRLAVLGKVYLYPELLSYYRTSDSETYKGDTLQKMAAKSIWMKKGLLKRSSSFAANMYYIETMRVWFRLAELHGIDLEVCGRLDMIARLLGCNRLLRTISNVPMKVVVRLALYRLRI